MQSTTALSNDTCMIQLVLLFGGAGERMGVTHSVESGVMEDRIDGHDFLGSHLTA